MRDWAVLLANRRFRSYWLALLGYALGNWCIIACLPILVAERFGAGGELVLSLGLRIAPKILLAPVSGAVQRRFGSGRIAGAAMAADAALTALIPWCHDFGLLQALIALIGILDVFIMPGLLSSRSQVLIPGLELAGNTLCSVADRVGKVIGPLVGGLIVLAGFERAFGLCAAGMAVASLPVLLLPRPASGADTARPDWQLTGQITEFLHVLRADRVLRVLVWIAFTYVVMLGGLRPFLFWSNREWFHGADNAWTTLVAAQGVGALIGAVVSGLTSRWVARHTTAFAVTIWTGLMESALHLTLLFAATPGQAMVLLALASIPETLCNVTWMTSAQERLSPRRQSVFFVFTAPVWDVGFAVGIFSAGLYAGGTLSLGQWWGLLVLAELAPMIQVVALYRGLLKRA